MIPISFVINWTHFHPIFITVYSANHLRIISGTFKGRHIHAPKNLPVRPTTDFAKTGLFNIIQNHFEIENLKILDLFAGTGNISYEFVSRGCPDITCVDLNFQCIRFIQESLKLMKAPAAKVIKYDVFKFLKVCNETYGFIFADPPYDLEEGKMLPDLVFQKHLLRAGGWFVLEHSSNVHHKHHPNFKSERDYGKVAFSIFENLEK
jgi:16S rRNA (guanine966-N2)-methyltransferase